MAKKPKKLRDPRSGDCLCVTEGTKSWSFVVLWFEDGGETWFVIRQGETDIETVELDEILPKGSTYQFVTPQSIGKFTADDVAQWMCAEVVAKQELEQELAALHIRDHFGREFVDTTEDGGYSIIDRVRRRFKKLHQGTVTYDRHGHYWTTN